MKLHSTRQKLTWVSYWKTETETTEIILGHGLKVLDLLDV